MIYEHWFVQFDFPDANGKPYKSSGGAMVWSEELKQEIPDGWGVKSISDICECKDANRVPLSTKERENMCGNIPYYGATGIMDYVNQHIFDGDYLLFAEDGSIMNDAGFPILQLISGKTWVNNHAHILSPKNGFSCKLLQLMFEKIPVCKIKTGSIQPKITQENLMGYRVLIADTSIRDKMIEKIDIIQQAIFNFKSEINNTTNLRDWLLPMLINGQVTVGE